MKRLAKIISYVFHPFYMTLLGVFIIFNLDLFLPYSHKSAIQFIFMVVGLATLLLPLSLIPLYLYQGIIESMEMKTRKERFIPLLITSFIYYLSYLLLRRLMITEIILAFILACTSTLFFITMVTYYYKLSIHMAGLGGLTGLLLYVSMFFNINTLSYLIPLILITGFTGMARLILGSHKPPEIYIGWGVGILSVFLVMCIYLN